MTLPLYFFCDVLHGKHVFMIKGFLSPTYSEKKGGDVIKKKNDGNDRKGDHLLEFDLNVHEVLCIMPGGKKVEPRGLIMSQKMTMPLDQILDGDLEESNNKKS